MKILFVSSHVSVHLSVKRALDALGHEVLWLDPYEEFSTNWFVWRWIYETGGIGLASYVERSILARTESQQFDAAFICGGVLLGPSLIQKLRSRVKRIVNYNLDNPFEPRDHGLWRYVLRSVKHYDLFVTPRTSSAVCALALGARRVLVAPQCADGSLHRPPYQVSWESRKFKYEVVFVGTYMPERAPLIEKLLLNGVPLKVRGRRWHRARNFKRIASAIVGNELIGEAYVNEIFQSKICLCLLSEGNKDLHTTRSVEIPAIGSVLCAPRTSDHSELYEDGKEAIFWSDAAECAEKCKFFLANPALLAKMSVAGRERALANGHFVEFRIQEVLSLLMGTGKKLDDLHRTPKLRRLYDSEQIVTTELVNEAPFSLRPSAP